MTVQAFDDPALRAAMTAYLDVARRLDEISSVGDEARNLLDFFLLEKALWLAENGRPGPVWLDIPIDVQSAMIDPDNLRGFDPASEDDGRLKGDALREPARQVIAMLREAKRPVLLPGTGVRIARAHELFCKVADKLGIAVASAERTSRTSNSGS